MIEKDPSIVDRAHEQGLKVHPYTFRADETPSKYPNVEAELKAFYADYDVDGVFTDFTDIAKGIRDSVAR